MLKYLQNKVDRYRYKYAFYMYQKSKYTTALKHFTILARKGNVYCRSIIGIMYYRGEGAEKDLQESLYWHKKAAQDGFHCSQSILSSMYTLGYGTSVDLVQALHWALKAAKQGSLYSQYDLCYLYVQAECGARDLQLAYMWCYIAVKNGFPDVQGRLATLNQVLSPQQVEEARHMAKICYTSGYKECFTEKSPKPSSSNVIDFMQYKRAKGL